MATLKWLIEIVGVDDRSTRLLKLENQHQKGYLRGSEDVFYLEVRDVGIPLSG